jgi:hypothetical protein
LISLTFLFTFKSAIRGVSQAQAAVQALQTNQPQALANTAQPAINSVANDQNQPTREDGQAQAPAVEAPAPAGSDATGAAGLPAAGTSGGVEAAGVEPAKAPTNRTAYVAEVRRQLGDLQPGDVLENDMGDKWTVDVVMRNKAGEVTGFLPREGNPETGEREVLDLDAAGSVLLPTPYLDASGNRKLSQPGKVNRAQPATPAEPQTEVPAEGAGAVEAAGVGETIVSANSTENIDGVRAAKQSGKKLAYGQYGDGTVTVGPSLDAKTHITLQLAPAERKALNKANALDKLAESQDERQEANKALEDALAPAIDRAISTAVTNPPTQAQAGTLAEGAGESRPAPVAAPEPTAEQKIRQVFDAAPRTIGSWHKLTVEHNGKTQEFLANMKRVNTSGKRDSAIHLVNIRPGRLMAGDPLQDLAYYYKLDGKNNLVEEGIPSIATPEQLKAFGRPDPRLIPVSQRKQAPYSGPADVSSRAGQIELANRGGRIASLKAMNEQLRKIAPGEAWADSNIESATDLDALQSSISQALVDAGRARANPEQSPLKARLDELSGQELRAVFDVMSLAGSRMTATERVNALLAENPQEVEAALDQVSPRNVPKKQANLNTSAEPAQKPPESEQVEANDQTPKQYHDARLRKMSDDTGTPLAEVREFYDTEGGRAESDRLWSVMVDKRARDGATLARQTLDKFYELNPTARLPETAFPNGYQRPDARKQEAIAKDAIRQDRREAKAARAASEEQVGPYGRDLTPIAQGGKPFKTQAEAAKFRKKNTNGMVIKKTDKGYVLTEASAKQLAAWEKAGKRLGLPQTAGEGPQHVHGFLMGKGGLSKAMMQDSGFDRNPQVGNRTLFAREGGLTAERATELLAEAGYLRPGASHSEMFDLVRRSLTTPQYTADGWDRIAQAEQSTRFEDHLAVEQEATPEADDFDALFPRGDDAYTQEEIALVPKSVREEYAALMEAAEAAGVDVDAILEDGARISENQTQEQFNEYVRQALTDAIADSRREADRRESAVQGRQDAERGGTESSRQNAGGSGAQEGVGRAAAESAATRTRPRGTINFANPITGPSGTKLTAYTWQWKPMEFVDARGEERVARISDWDNSETNAETGREVVHQFVVEQNGESKTVSAESAIRALGYGTAAEAGAAKSAISAAKTLARLQMQLSEVAQAVEAYEADKAEVILLTPPEISGPDEKGWYSMGDTRVRQLEKGPLRGERRRTLLDHWRDDRLSDRGWKGGSIEGGSLQRTQTELQDRIKRATKKLDAINSAELTAPTPAQVLEQQDRADRAEELDQREQIQREAEGFQLQAQAPEQRQDNTGDMFGGPSVEDYQKSMERSRQPGAAPEGPDLFSAPAETAPEPAKPAAEMSAAELLRAAADKMEAAEKPKTEPAKAPEKIDDIGEKIGGARKDTAVSTGTRKKAASEEDDRPTWAKRFRIAQVAGGFDVSVNGRDVTGKWTLSDTRTLDRMGQPKRMGEYFDSKEAAEAALPLLALAQKHRAVPVNTADGQKYEIWRDINDRKRVKVVDRQFDTRDEAMRYMAQNAVQILETNTTFGEADLPKPESTQRIGVERRAGDVKGEDFRDTFGFRGVEFGLWNNQDERQEVMNAAYDGLLDLAEVLKVPPKAIGLNGDLALAFGARGKGLSGARAHYETDRVVMNLTKMNGAGALAHEWFHALDHYLARQDGKTTAEWKINKDGTRSLDVSGGEADMASGGFRRANSGVREELRNAYTDLVQSLFTKAEQYVEDTARADKFVAVARGELEKDLSDLRKDLSEQKDVRYYKRNNKPASAEQLAEFDAMAAELVDGRGLSTEWKVMPGKSRSSIQTRHTNETLEKLNELYKAVRGRSGFNTERRGVLDSLVGYMTRYEQRLKMLSEATALTPKTKRVPTSFAMDAKSLDQGRGGDYWTSPHEMVARAFQGYVEDAIAAKEGRSPFLNYAPENAGILTPWGAKRPFPAGEERKAMNAEFDKFIDVLQTRETDDGNVAMFSRAGSFSFGLPLSEAQAIVKDLTKKWKNGPPVFTVATPRDLPVDAPDDANGMYFKGQVWIVASAHRTAADVSRTLGHEAIAHYGLRNVLGTDEWRRFMANIQLALKSGNKLLKDIQARVRRAYVDGQGRFNLTANQEADEIAAKVVEDAIGPDGEFRPGFGFVKSVYARIVEFLRDLGLDVKLTMAEVQGMLVLAQRNLEAGRRTGGGGEVVVAASMRALDAPTLNSSTAATRIAEFRAKYPATPPSGMDIDAARAWLRDRRAAFDALVQELTPSADGLTLPVKSGGTWMVSREARPDGSEWRITRFDKNMEPQGHEAHNSAANAVADMVSWADVARLKDWQPEFSRTPQTDTQAFKSWFGNSVVTDTGRLAGRRWWFITGRRLISMSFLRMPTAPTLPATMA